MWVIATRRISWERKCRMTPVWYLSLQNKTDEDVLAVSSYPELKNIVNRVIKCRSA
ncbi:MAG: hypothetical protein ACLTDF_00705 [Coprococcus sp.]